MKHTFLLLAVLAVFNCTQAQSINKTLLAGKWKLYTVKGEGNTFYNHHRESVADMIKREKAYNPGFKMSAADSAKLAVSDKARFDSICKTFITFDGKDNVTVVLTCYLDPTGKPLPETGTYQWTAANRIRINMANAKPADFSITRLTGKKLVLESGDPKNLKHYLQLTLIRK